MKIYFQHIYEIFDTVIIKKAHTENRDRFSNTPQNVGRPQRISGLVNIIFPAVVTHKNNIPRNEKRRTFVRKIKFVGKIENSPRLSFDSASWKNQPRVYCTRGFREKWFSHIVAENNAQKYIMKRKIVLFERKPRFAC